jgi:hypothetical protein
MLGDLAGSQLYECSLQVSTCRRLFNKYTPPLHTKGSRALECKLSQC